MSRSVRSTTRVITDSLAPNDCAGLEGVSMRAVVIRHHDVDSAGFIEEAFEAHGAVVETYLFPDEAALPDLSGVDHIVVLGAVPSVNDDVDWIAAELAWLRDADQAGIPIFGVCFGAQLLSALSGG